VEDERQVTANLSKNLELERRKVESLEQKAKVPVPILLPTYSIGTIPTGTGAGYAALNKMMQVLPFQLNVWLYDPGPGFLDKTQPLKRTV